jgi:hypothetical protein
MGWNDRNPITGVLFDTYADTGWPEVIGRGPLTPVGKADFAGRSRFQRRFKQYRIGIGVAL